MRPVTALFADVVGSTGLGERLGPDEVKALVGEFVTRMSRAVEEFGGVVQAYMGDGICGLFGVPVAHEDDPERAARAALRIVTIAASYAGDVRSAWGISGFDVRVGLNSGPVAVGLVGGADAQTVAVGDTTNVAARLQAAAEPGTIAVGPVATERLEEAFVLEPLGARAVKGRTEPVETWRLVGPRPAAEPTPRTALVGRERERSHLEAAARDLEAGRGQVLVVLGDAGLGKTRTLAELRRRVGDGAAWLGGRCASYGAETPYGPLVEVLRAWVGVEETDAELAVRTKLRARTGALLGPLHDRAVPYLGLLLSIRLDPDQERELLGVPAEELAARQRDAFLTWAEAVAGQRPLVLAIDDLHWANATTRELAERLLDLTDRAAVLLAVAMRPDPASEGWRFRMTAQGRFAHRAVELSLTPLTPRASAELVDALAPPGLLAPAIRDELVSKAEGNPLFLEELVRAILESGGDRHRTWTLTAGAAADLPPALESLLVARIDRLEPSARNVAQVAAVVGREFPASVVTAVARSDDADRDLATLLRADIVRELRRFPELECTFRHGLLQEAALATLTSTALRDLYARVGEAMEAHWADAVDDHLEDLAFYFYRSAQPARALDYLGRAAARARAIDATDHARELWSRAGRLAQRLGDEDARARIDVELASLDGRADADGQRDADADGEPGESTDG
jgi:class 3 adenylate cyclase/predicted ATPase